MSSAELANRKTAERCLKLAESYVIKKQWKTAMNQAEMGLSYDPYVSDLIYIKAAALSNLNATKREVLDVIGPAFEYNTWISLNKNDARLLYADYLSETGEFDKALDILNEEPLLYSADAEFIRIKTLYRIGTKDSVTQARTKLATSRKIYPLDERFPRIFFMFESLFMNASEKYGQQYELPPDVLKIAMDYIVKFPDYKTKDIEMELFASMLISGETQKRLLQAIGEKNNFHPLYAYVALKAGVISQEKAFNLFFDSSDNFYPLYLIESFAPLITDEQLKVNLIKHINSFSGTLAVDEDLDLRKELIIKYERGRPQYISYDENTDGVLEVYAACDFGVPLSVSFVSNKIDLFYDLYPAVQRVSMNGKNGVFYFLGDDYSYTPFEMTVHPPFESLGVDFYVPYIKKDLEVPDYDLLFSKAARFDVNTYERNASYVRYTFLDGKPRMAYFYEGKKFFAYGDVSKGFPFVRYVDYDGDEIYETTEYFDIDTEDVYATEEDKKIIKTILGDIPFAQKIYLKKVEVDRDSDTLIEFKEEYLPNGGKIISWDNDDNGIWDSEYIIYAPEKDGTVKDESIFYNSNGLEYICVTQINNVPFNVRVNQVDYPVFKGNGKNVFWLGEQMPSEIERKAFEIIGKNIDNVGAVQIAEVDGNRITTIKIGQNIYCRRVTDIDE